MNDFVSLIGQLLKTKDLGSSSHFLRMVFIRENFRCLLFSQINLVKLY